MLSYCKDEATSRVCEAKDEKEEEEVVAQSKLKIRQAIFTYAIVTIYKLSTYYEIVNQLSKCNVMLISESSK